jgi:hypothetical protein
MSTSAVASTANDVSLATKTVRVPMFDGKRDNFQVWWIRFRAFATAQKFIKAVSKDKEVEMPGKEEDAATDTTANAAARSRNDTAVYYLTLAFETPASMKFLFMGMTNPEWPSGLAHLIIKALLRKFKPEDATSGLEFIEELNKIRMSPNEDPSTLFTQVGMLQNRYGIYNTQPDHLIAVVISALPIELKKVVATLKIVKSGSLRSRT